MLDNFNLYFPNMRVSRFQIKAGDTIPLHCHPNQYGFIYVLAGKCLIKNFETLNQNQENYQLKLINEVVVRTNDYLTITPTYNAHIIVAQEETVFLELFAPGVKSGFLSQHLEIKENLRDNILVAKTIDIKSAKLPDYILHPAGNNLEVK